MPGRLAVLRPVWILPALQGILLVTLFLANPHRIDRESRVLRILGLTLAALISFANAWSLVNLAIGLVGGTEGESAGALLVTAVPGHFEGWFNLSESRSVITANHHRKAVVVTPNATAGANVEQLAILGCHLLI